MFEYSRHKRRALKSLRLLRSEMGRRGLRYGVGATIEHSQALAGLSFATIVDVGANKGQFSLFCLDRFPGARIIAFEPLAGPARIFENLFAAQPQITLFQAAIGPDCGEAKIYVSRRADSSSLLPITHLQNKLFPGTELKEMQTVKIGRLDTYLGEQDLASPALLKIDVQGFELKVLEGTAALLSKFDNVYVECSHVELYEGQSSAPRIIEYLGKRGFPRALEFNMLTDDELGPVQADYLFSRER